MILLKILFITKSDNSCLVRINLNVGLVTILASLVFMSLTSPASAGREIICENDWDETCNFKDGPHTVSGTYEGPHIMDSGEVWSRARDQAVPKHEAICGPMNAHFNRETLEEDIKTCEVIQKKLENDNQEDPPLFPHYSKCTSTWTGYCLGVIKNPNRQPPPPQENIDPDQFNTHSLTFPDLSDRINAATEEASSLQAKRSQNLDGVEKLAENLEGIQRWIASLASADETLDEEFEVIKEKAERKASEVAETARKRAAERREKSLKAGLTVKNNGSGKCGYIDFEGIEVVPIKNDWCNDKPSKGFYIVSNGETGSVYDISGNLVLSAQGSIGVGDNGFTVTTGSWSDRPSGCDSYYSGTYYDVYDFQGRKIKSNQETREYNSGGICLHN